MGISTYSDLTRSHKKYLLYHLALIISENDIDGSLMIKTLLNASYPIIRITQSKLSLQIDVSIADKFCEPTNDFLSNILSYFESLNIPIKPFIVFIKHWSKQRGINNAYRRYLNSYAYTLLVISFLQSHDCTDLKLAYLVYRFFEFDAEIHAISVSVDCAYKKEKFDKKRYCVEKKGYDVMEIVDPINCKNNVAQRVGFSQCLRIKQEFVCSYQLIKKYRDKTITDRQSIFDLLLRKNNALMNGEDKENMIHLEQNLYVYDYKAANCELYRKCDNFYDGKYFQNNGNFYNLYYQNPFKNAYNNESAEQELQSMPAVVRVLQPFEHRYGNPFRNRSVNQQIK